MGVSSGQKKGNVSALVELLKECVQDKVEQENNKNKEKFTVIDSTRQNDESTGIFNMVY